MMDIITGKTRPDTGTCWFGSRMNLLQMSEPRSRAGIGRKFQKPTVFECHSVFENLELSMAGPKGVWRTLRARLAPHERARIDEVLELIGLADSRTTPGRIPVARPETVAGNRHVADAEPPLLLVDEPAAGMTHQEMDRTVELLTSLAGEHSVVVVEHDMDFVRALDSRVTVLHQGSVLAEGSMDQATGPESDGGLSWRMRARAVMDWSAC